MSDAKRPGSERSGSETSEPGSPDGGNSDAAASEVGPKPHSPASTPDSGGSQVTIASVRRYTSAPRAALRFVAQRLLFKTFVWRIVTVTATADPAVRSLKGPYVVVANHSSHLDAPLIACGMPHRQGRYLSTGVARDYFFDNKIRKVFTGLVLNAFPIDRKGEGDNRGLARRLVGAGVPILLFPEGTRSKTGMMAPFKPGAAVLAARAGVPCIPTAVVGGFEAMPKGRGWPAKGRPPVSVTFGAPLYHRKGESFGDFNGRLEAAVRALKAA